MDEIDELKLNNSTDTKEVNSESVESEIDEDNYEIKTIDPKTTTDDSSDYLEEIEKDNEKEIDGESEINGFRMLDTTETAEVNIDDNIKEKDNKKPFLKDIFSYILLIAVAFGLAQIIHRFIFTPITVIGTSMKTTIYAGDRIFLSRLSKIERFDIVVFDVENSDDPYIKRVIGLPGDTVRMEDYVLYINNNLEPENYLDKNPIYTGIEFANYEDITSFTLEYICGITNLDCQQNGEILIPEGYYLVLGDNRNNSNDSRSLGLIPENKILGEAIFVFYPFNRFGKTFE